MVSEKVIVKNQRLTNGDILFKERLLKLMQGEKPYAWASANGIAKSSMHNILQSGRPPGADQLIKISNATGVSIDWLLKGEESSFPSTAGEVEKHKSDDLLWLTVAGHSNLTHKDKMPFSIQWLSHYTSELDNIVVVFQTGDSMEPTLSKDDLLLVDKSKNDISNAGIYVIENKGSHEAKRIQRGMGDEVLISNDNSRYANMTVKKQDRAQLNIIGKVVYYFHGL